MVANTYNVNIWIWYNTTIILKLTDLNLILFPIYKLVYLWLQQTGIFHPDVKWTECVGGGAGFPLVSTYLQSPFIKVWPDPNRLPAHVWVCTLLQKSYMQYANISLKCERNNKKIIFNPKILFLFYDGRKIINVTSRSLCHCFF